MWVLGTIYLARQCGRPQSGLLQTQGSHRDTTSTVPPLHDCPAALVPCPAGVHPAGAAHCEPGLVRAGGGWAAAPAGQGLGGAVVHGGLRGGWVWWEGGGQGGAVVGTCAGWDDVGGWRWVVMGGWGGGCGGGKCGSDVVRRGDSSGKAKWAIAGSAWHRLHAAPLVQSQPPPLQNTHTMRPSSPSC